MWNRNNGTNFVIKITLLLLSFWGAFLALQDAGYIVQGTSFQSSWNCSNHENPHVAQTTELKNFPECSGWFVLDNIR
jgi:hypothetical protein